MNARRSVMTLCAATSLLLAGCGSSTTSSPADTPPAGETEVSTPTVTSPDSTTPTRTITVEAVGTAEGVPDEISLTIAAETYAPTTAEALRAVSGQADALSAYLLEQGIAAADLQTTSLSVYPQYGGYAEPQGQPTIVGYQASVTMSVRVRDLDMASTIVDGAALVVGDALRVYGMSWAIGDRDELLAEARVDAVQRARDQAAQLAEVAGLRLGDIAAVTEVTEVPYAYTEGGGDGASGYPFYGGTQTVRVAVTVEFEATPLAS